MIVIFRRGPWLKITKVSTKSINKTFRDDNDLHDFNPIILIYWCRLKQLVIIGIWIEAVPSVYSIHKIPDKQHSVTES